MLNWRDGMDPVMQTSVSGADCQLMYRADAMRRCKEGAEVLYGTNTIFIESRTLLEEWFSASPRIQHLVSPQHLQSVTSLELVWDGTLFDRDGNPYGIEEVESDRAFLSTTLEHIGAETLPNVRSLTLVFTHRLFFNTGWTPPDFIPQIDKMILQPAARAVARLPQPQARPVIMLLPHDAFVSLRSQGPHVIGLGEKLDRADGEWLVYPGPSVSDRTGEYYIHGSA